MAVEQVIIDFVADYSGLQPAIDMLEKAGQIDASIAQNFKQTNAEINKQAQALRSVSQATSQEAQSIDQMDKRMKSFLKNAIQGFEEGVADALNEAGVSMEEFTAALKDAGIAGEKSTTSLRQELKNLTQQIAEAKVNGTDLGEEYQALVARAGELRDAIADAGAEISNAGSDTRHLDNVIGTVQALAGGYALVQGATALFGDTNEELQKTLLKVNAAMAALQGLQSIQNAIQKEGAVTKLADVVATKAQIAVQRIYTAVTGQATAATTAFKIALATTGIGIVVVGVLALVQALKDSNDEMEQANQLIDAQNSRLQSQNKLLRDNADIQIARAGLISDKESDIIRIRGIALQAQVKNIQVSNRILAIERDSLDRTSEAWFKLNSQIEDNTDLIRELNKDITIEGINLQKALQDEAKKAADKAKQDRDKRLADERAARLAGFEDFKAGVELELLAVEEGSEKQLALKKKLLNAELQIALENEKLTTNQRKLLVQQYFKDAMELQKQFGRDRNKQILEDIASDLNAELQSLSITNERKLELTESAIQIQSALEIEAANGNAAKIAEINAKMDRQIREARLASIRDTFEAEARIADATGGAGSRALERVATDEKQKLEVRINALNQLEQREAESIQRRIALNESLFNQGLISQQEYNVTAAELLDQQAKVYEEFEKRKTELTLSEVEKRKQATIEAAQTAIEVFSEVVNTLSVIYQEQTARENDKLSEQKQKIQDLLEAGAITEKEAVNRQKRLEAEERRIRQQQAQREKQVAMFNAFLAIPQAVLKGLSQGGPILAAVYGALATVQAVAIASRPVPRFATGKKGSYEGPGIMGEAGAELIQRADGSMYVSTKPTLVYVGSKDKIFTAGETKRMMPKVEKSVMRAEKSDTVDYDKLAAAIIKGYKPTPGATINIDKEFISESIAGGLSKVNYYDRYYSSK